VLQVINASRGELAPVFDAMLEKATRICDPAFGLLLTWDGERYHRTAWRGVSFEDQAEASREPVHAPGFAWPSSRHGCKDVVCIDDIANDEGTRDACRRFLCALGRPIVARGAVRGGLCLRAANQGGLSLGR
jgi:hypothetical protein